MPANSVAIRPSAEADVAEIAAIYAEAVLHGTASFEIVPPDETEMAARRRAVLAMNLPYLVAEDGGRVLGYAYAAPYRTRPAYRSTVEDSIYVAPDAQGRGVGRALLTRLIAEAEARGFRQMVAVIGDSGNVPSIGIHRALGFSLIGTLRDVGYKHGRWLDSVLMQRALGAGATTPPTVGA